jgi:hypothetical protein
VATLESIEAQLNTLLTNSHAQAAVVGASVAKAYDSPVLSVDQVVVGSKVPNKDGSEWVVQIYGPQKGQPICDSFGYISPVKTPEVWAFAKAHLSPEVFAAWDAGWRANPFGLYKVDLRPEIANGAANFMSFNMAYTQPFRTFVQ